MLTIIIRKYFAKAIFINILCKWFTSLPGLGSKFSLNSWGVAFQCQFKEYTESMSFYKILKVLILFNHERLTFFVYHNIFALCLRYHLKPIITGRMSTAIYDKRSKYA